MPKIVIYLFAIIFLISCNNNSASVSKNEGKSEIEESKFYLLVGNIVVSYMLIHIVNGNNNNG